MTAVRSDLLRVCNDQNVPLDDFKRAFCDRCLQPECTRSRSGASKFEQRIANWNEKLFTNPPTLDPSDPRYARITGQRFLMIDPGPMPEVRTSSAASASWVDPRDLSDTGQQTAAQPRAVTSATTLNRPAPSPPSAPPEKHDLYRVAAINTPIPAPRMIGAAEKPSAPALKPDAWAGKETPLPPGEPVVKPGAKVRLGGGGTPGV